MFIYIRVAKKKEKTAVQKILSGGGKRKICEKCLVKSFF